MEFNIYDGLTYQNYIQEFKVSPLVAKILAYHQVDQERYQELMSTRLKYHSFELFDEGEMALERIFEAIGNNEKICIYGDYDSDGILGTSILVNAFKQLGVDVGFHIPNRFFDGYGLTPHRVEQINSKGYSLIITVDNGIQAFDAIEKANELGVDVIVTDHHEVGQTQPEAMSIIHPKTSCNYPFKEISGGFTAYKLASALLKKHDPYLFSLAGITILSDVMPIVDENRALVKKALEFMNENNYPTISLLKDSNAPISPTLLNFQVIPKINSLGRLPEIISPNKLVRYFALLENQSYCIDLAQKVKDVNAKRKEMTQRYYDQIMTQANEGDFLFFASKKLHQGISGLIASRYTNTYNQPSFVMTYDEQSQMFKGSARSVAGINITKAFGYCDDLLDHYGGHDLAGGFSLKQENLKEFRLRLEQFIKEEQFSAPVKDVIKVTSQELTIENILDLEKLEPFGPGFENVDFYFENIAITNLVTLSNGQHLKFKAGTIDCLFFNHGHLVSQLSSLNSISFAGKLTINEFRNKKSINVHLSGIKGI